MNARNIISWLVITEKSMNLMDNKKYTFGVLVSATKTQVRNAVEEIFGVKIKNVNIMSVRSEEKRVGCYTGKTTCRREVIVTLIEDSSDIKIFDDNKKN